MTDIVKEFKALIAEDNKETFLIGGDFNARVGNEGTIIQGDDRDKIAEGESRRSRNKTINTEGKKFLEEIEEKGWDILNKSTAENEEGELTYIRARGSSVSNYAIGNIEARKKIDRLVIAEKTESDYLPICIYI